MIHQFLGKYINIAFNVSGQEAL